MKNKLEVQVFIEESGILVEHMNQVSSDLNKLKDEPLLREDADFRRIYVCTKECNLDSYCLQDYAKCESDDPDLSYEYKCIDHKMYHREDIDKL